MISTHSIHLLNPEKPYNDINDYFKIKFQRKIRKISLNIGKSCPNRDKGKGGCIFCAENGSASQNSLQGAMDKAMLWEQIEQGLRYYKKKFSQQGYLAYFQAFTPTYLPFAELKNHIQNALEHPLIDGFILSSRADCFSPELAEYLQSFHGKKIFWVEIGMQSIHNSSLEWLNRQETHTDLLNALALSDHYQIPVVAHVILGIPGESRQDMLNTARFLCESSIWGIKIHNLQPLPQTRLFRLYKRDKFIPLSLPEYADLLIDFIQELSPKQVIHRLLNDFHGKPFFFENDKLLTKNEALQRIYFLMKEKSCMQGKNACAITNSCIEPDATLQKYL